MMMKLLRVGSSDQEGQRPLDDTADGHHKEAFVVARRVAVDTGTPEL